MTMELFKIDANGSVQVWEIYGRRSDSTIYIRYGQLNGSMQVQKDVVKVNKSGRGIEEQMILEIRSRITKQKAKGYRTSIEEARKHRNQNALNLAKPMLAQRFDKIPIFNHDTCFRQYKYDGHRMLVHRAGDELVAYSRNGKIIDTLDHILNSIDIPDGATIDGEVYCHGVPLQTIASWCKRKQSSTEELEYVVYDTIAPHPFGDRLQMLKDWELGEASRIASTWTTRIPVAQDLKEAIQLGYEGLILRTNDRGYSVGKRCRSLIKVKQTMDDEFLVVDVEASRDGWGVLVCLSKSGKPFRVSAPGTMEEKTFILDNKLDYIGLMVRVEYFSITKEGIPFHPVAIDFREKGDE